MECQNDMGHMSVLMIMAWFRDTIWYTGGIRGQILIIEQKIKAMNVRNTQNNDEQLKACW